MPSQGSRTCFPQIALDPDISVRRHFPHNHRVSDRPQRRTIVSIDSSHKVEQLSQLF